MKNLFIACLLLLSCGTHNVSKGLYKNVNKSGNFISIDNIKDTLMLGDTMCMTFELSSSVKLDDGSVIQISNITNTGFGYQVKKSYLAPWNNFNFAPLMLEQKESYGQDDIGRFYFKPALKKNPRKQNSLCSTRYRYIYFINLPKSKYNRRGRKQP
jgi:hypothetical protein